MSISKSMKFYNHCVHLDYVSLDENLPHKGSQTVVQLAFVVHTGDA